MGLKRLFNHKSVSESTSDEVQIHTKVAYRRFNYTLTHKVLPFRAGASKDKFQLLSKASKITILCLTLKH